MNHPNSREWRWQHQLLLSVCLICLGISHVLIQGHQRVNSASGNQLSFIASVSFTSCASAILNCMFMLGGPQYILLRASSMTGTFTDLFVLLGSSLRERSTRYLWKARVYFLAILCFFVGGLIGALIFEDKTMGGLNALTVIIIMLAPLWLLGAFYLVFPRSVDCLGEKPVQLGEKGVTSARSFISSSSEASKFTSSVSLVAITHDTAGDQGEVTKSAPNGSTQISSSARAMAILEDCHDEFNEIETEGLGLRIHSLPRINVLEDDSLRLPLEEAHQNTLQNSSPTIKTRTPGEYEELHYSHFAWICYLPIISGSMNAIALQGLFHISIAITGAITNMGIRVKYPPPPNGTGSRSLSAPVLLCPLLAFALSCSLFGFTLTLPGSSNPSKYALRKMDYPNIKEWRWKHQAFLTLCILSLCLAYGITRSFIGDDKDFAGSVDYRNSDYAAFLFAFSCLAFSAGILNMFSSLGRRITLRASHVSGTINDIFLGIGFALRSRSLRYIWRVRALLLNLISFCIGGVIGSLLFNSSFAASALVFPIILLLPLWVVGIALLIAQRRKYYM
jgi:uncharacterized membrane protein YoaK (UPF0700 family)